MNLLLPIKMKVRAPLAVRGNMIGQFGIDTPLFRRSDGNFAIPDTIIIGKLRDAYRQFVSVLDEDEKNESFAKDFEFLFASSSGKKADDEADGREARRALTCSDFILINHEQKHQVRTRNAKDDVTKTVADGMLQVIEQIAPSGQELTFSGELRVTGRAGDDELAFRIQKAFQWILQVGGLKSVGFGEIVGVQADSPAHRLPAGAASPNGPIGFRLRFRDHFCIGEERTSRNTFTSGKCVPGGVIKGAIAQQIAQRFSLSGSLSKNLEGLDGSLRYFAERFDELRIRHALPVKRDELEERQLALPHSMAIVGDKYVDLSQLDQPSRPHTFDGFAPKLTNDWKFEEAREAAARLGISKPELEFRMRVEVDYRFRAAAENRLFAVEYCRSDTHDFIGYIDPPANAERQKIIDALHEILVSGLAGLGRGGAYADIELLEDYIDNDQHMSRRGAIILKTPALLRSPDLGCETDLRKIYAAAFRSIGLPEMCTLKAAFVQESLSGSGFMSRRRGLSATPPFLLTKPGSVFVFDLPNEAALPDIWYKDGLDVPESVLNFYGLKAGRDLWSDCPYVPQNGYGEICNHESSFEPVQGTPVIEVGTL